MPIICYFILTDSDHVSATIHYYLFIYSDSIRWPHWPHKEATGLAGSINDNRMRALGPIPGSKEHVGIFGDWNVKSVEIEIEMMYLNSLGLYSMCSAYLGCLNRPASICWVSM